MTLPYTPTVLATPIVNPSAGSQGVAPIPYLSNSMYEFAPTAINVANLVPGGDAAQQAQVLADVLLRASRWADTYCFGADAAGSGASLAANLSIEQASTRVKMGELRLICDYRPIQQVIGIDVGFTPGNVASIGPQVASNVRIGRRTLYVPLWGIPTRSGDVGGPSSLWSVDGSVYAVWSYVAGYPHTRLVNNVTASATSCVVKSTDGNGGVWGALISPYFTVFDGQYTETVKVTAVTPGTTTATLTTTPFVNAHTVPSAPDFLPFTTIAPDIQQAVISLTTMLIKTRGVKSLTMPSMPGAAPSRQGLAQAGALEDFDIAARLLHPYAIRNKSKN